MAQFPDVVDEWTPLGNQFLDTAISAALTIPALPSGNVAKGAVIVAILLAQGVAQWMRTDGVAPTATFLGGIKLNIGDYRIVYGQTALTKVRVIRDAVGGSLGCEYYYFRPSQ